MKFKAIYIDDFERDIVLGVFESKEEAQQAIDNHIKKSESLIKTFSVMKALYTGKYKIDVVKA